MEQAHPAQLDRQLFATRDRARIQRLYSFCLARAVDRIAVAQRRDPEGTTRERHGMHVLEALYDKSMQDDGIVTSCAVTYFRVQAMRDAQHPDFRGEWI